MKFIFLCGGSGTRLWPISRSQNPKQLHSFISSNTLLQDTVLRVKGKYENSKYIFVTNHSLYKQVLLNLIDIGLNENEFKILIEPEGKNSAPAILMGTLMLENDNDWIVVMSCDHKWDDDAFNSCIHPSNLSSYENKIITIGIQPSIPHTGYGYIKKKNINDIDEFKEKPNLEQAKEYLLSGQYLWNSGTFIFKYNTLIDAFSQYKPDMLNTAYINIDNIEYLSNNFALFNKDNFSQFENISFDYAIMENIHNGTVLAYNSIWSDIGSFDAIYDILEKDLNQNVIKQEIHSNGSILTHNTTSSYILNKTDQLISTVGIHNLVVVNTNDCLLIMNKDNCQDIKKIIEKIQNSNINKDILHF